MIINLSISDTVADIFNSICKGISYIIDHIFSLFPENPFKDIEVTSELSSALGYINFFIPVKGIIIVISAWLSCLILIMISYLIFKFFRFIGG